MTENNIILAPGARQLHKLVQAERHFRGAICGGRTAGVTSAMEMAEDGLLPAAAGPI